MRAEPISLLYEKGRVLHRRGLDQLEADMMAFSRKWDRAVGGSPNRLDATVWALTRLSKVITDIPIA
jgi:phage terminase large subunit-like protein